MCFRFSSTPSLGSVAIGVFDGGGDAALPAVSEEMVRLRTTDLVGGGVMLKALVTLLFVYSYARSGPAVTIES